MKHLVRGLWLIPMLGCLILLYYGASTLSAEPCMGVADILDFSRVTIPAGIEHLSPLEAPGYYVRCEFRITEPNFWAGPSSAALLALIAKPLRFLGPAPPGHLALRQMGLLCLGLAALMVTAGLLGGLRPILAMLFTYVIVDPGYLFFFNSFYADGALFLALLGLVIWLDRWGDLPKDQLRKPRIWFLSWILLVLLALLGGGSKMLFVLFPVVTLAALVPALVGLGRSDKFRTAALVISLVGVQLLVFWNFFYGSGPRFLEYNNFHAVYGGILQVSSKPESIYERLEIPVEHREIARTDAWSAGIGIDHPVHDHLRDLSRLELLRFYIEDPPALTAALRRIGDDLLLIASHPRGTYPRDPSDRHPVKRIYGETWQFSNLTRLAFAQSRTSIVLILAVAAAWILTAAAGGTWTGRSALMLFLLLWFFSQAALAVLGEGFINLHQHLVGARLALDLLLVVLVVELAEGMGRVHRFPAKKTCARWRLQ